MAGKVRSVARGPASAESSPGSRVAGDPAAATVIRVLVVDDHEMFSDTLVRLLADDPGIQVVGAAMTALEGVARARAEHPDIVLCDFDLPDMDGAAATRLLRDACPGVKVITLTGANLGGAYFAAMDAGAAGWIRKTRAFQDLRKAVHDVHRGELVGSEELAGLPTLDQLVVHYQPIVGLARDDVVGMEALVRWQHPETGLISPAEFLPRAEATGFMHQLTKNVARQACRQLFEWRRHLSADRGLWVSVNVSASSIKRASLVADIAEAIETSGVSPKDLVLEITESVLMDDGEATLLQLNRLKGLGVRLALDDFGTGYSSLSYLRRFPFDHVKIDTSFTAELPESARGMRLAESIHQLAAALGMDGIAEGVEREEQARALREIGWEFAQGYLYSRPVDESRATEFLRRSTWLAPRGV